jgi:ABC-type polysaccharide/polyol phosphate export permease
MSLTERLQELFRYRELIYNLTVRDLKLKYKGSALGVAWSLLNPLLMMVIYTAVFSKLLRVTDFPNYWALVLGGILAWTFFAGSVQSATTSFIRNPGLISKVYFPIESLPISMSLANFVNFGIPLVLLLMASVVAHVHIGASIVLLPLIVAAELALALGLSMMIAALTVFFRDIEHLIGIMLAAWFYLSPVIYPLNPALLPVGARRFLPLAWLNPLAWFLESYHSVLVYGTWPPLAPFVGMIALAALCLVAGYATFHRLRPRVPEEV